MLYSLKSFPQPLSVEEEAKVIQEFKAGSKEARDILVVHNLRLLAHIVKKYYTSNKDIDDMISIGTIGLIKAIDTFDPDKGIRLATYASRCIDNELLMMFRSGKKQSKETFLYEPIGSDKEGHDISLLDILESTDIDIVDKLELKSNIKHLYKYMDEVLTDREKLIIVMRYGLDNREPVTQKKIAKKIGISRSYVSRIEKKAIKKLRDRFDKEMID